METVEADLWKIMQMIQSTAMHIVRWTAKQLQPETDVVVDSIICQVDILIADCLVGN